MSEPADTGFTALRRAGLARAQEASGRIWTDYNLHDPGVTLLEQTCFALSELAHRAELPIRDLLTLPDGTLDHDGLALSHPRAVLGTAPVTIADLEARLGSLPGVARVVATAADGNLDLLVVPGSGEDPDAVARRVGKMFHCERPLGVRLNSLAPAEPHLCRLVAHVEIGPDAVPEMVAARIYHLSDRLIREPTAGMLDLHTGVPQDAPDQITRASVFDAPELLFGVRRRQVAEMTVDRVLQLALGKIDGVADIRSFALVPVSAGALDARPDADASAADASARPVASFQKIILPGAGMAPDLILRRNGQDVAFEAVEVQAALERLHAQEVAARTDPHAADVWELPDPGTPRRLGHVHVDADLPGAYAGAGGARFAGDNATVEAALAPLHRFRAVLDRMLAAMTADLQAVPGLLAADGFGADAPGARSPGWSYAADDAATASPRMQPAAITGKKAAPTGALPDRFATLLTPFFASAAPDATAEDLLAEVAASRGASDAFAAIDPWQDRRKRALDYLLGLQGEAWDDDAIEARNAYVDTGLVPYTEIARRRRLLAELPALDRTRGCGPDLSVAARGAGFLRKLTLCLDLPDPPDALQPISDLLRAAGLTVTHEGPDPEGPHPQDLVTPYDPLDMLVPLRDPGDLGDPAALLADVGFLSEGRVRADVFRAAARLENYVLAPAAAGRWQVLLEFAPDRLAQAGRAETKPDAILLANRIRFTCAALQAGSEGVHLVEHALLAPDDALRAPARLSLVFPGWTLRFAADGFRRHVCETVRALTPAHLHPTCHFLDDAAFRETEAALLAWRAALVREARAGLAPDGDGDARAAADAAGARVSTILRSLGDRP